MIPNVRCSFFFALFLSMSAFGQKIDSLEAVLDTAKNDHKVKTLNELFRANLRTDPVKALGYTREALNLATEIGDKKGMAASYNNLGIIYRNQGALDKALDYYITSLKIYEALNNQEGIASTKNNISTIYSIKKDYGQAMKYLEESYDLFVTLKDERRIIGSMNNLGNLNIEIQLYEKAMKYFSQASQLSEKLGIKFADPLSNMGNIYFKQSNFPRAIEFYEKALAIERENDNRLGMLSILTNLGITYAKAKQPAPAQRYLDEATTLCEQLQAYSFLPSLYKAQAENASTQNNWKVAYDMMLKYDDAREKIYGEESSRNIAQMEMVIDFQEKEKEYDMQRQQSEITKLELHNTRLFVLLIILAILGILGALNFFYVKKKARRKK
ncbi:tetratricopeptide repeat protein [Chryseolinea lacunae]|uniref:Tetratricopeptide repeat protein n=1 Tax=Chryseolinea lacunae TaxID=2801331 RepID=A0ABS1KJS2_9BACT|nr:tetratricopeptide repeat protein [Chryseolinea lacunae]MBL0739595.1 tetratricopeptide repeat protein [Chryseolinea lacunae]